MKKKISKGVVILGILWILVGLYYGAVNIAGKRLHHWDLVFLPILYIIIGVGILTLQNWARWLAMFAMIALILGGVLQFSQWMATIAYMSKSGYGILGATLFAARFVLAGMAIFFLTRPKVREQFIRRKDEGV